jgi:hypothetical protein
MIVLNAVVSMLCGMLQAVETCQIYNENSWPGTIDISCSLTPFDTKRKSLYTYAQSQVIADLPTFLTGMNLEMLSGGF